LSQANFARYLADMSAPARYFGWLASRLPHYPDTLNLKTMVVARSAGLRPLLELEPGGHPLAVDQRDGLTSHAAQALAGKIWHGLG